MTGTIFVSNIFGKCDELFKISETLQFTIWTKTTKINT